MTLNDLRDELLTVSESVFHFAAPSKTESPYIVWAEENEADSLDGNDKKLTQIIEGSIDLFTKTESDPLFFSVQAALRNCGASWKLSYIQYEEDSNFIHYEWVWRMEVDPYGESGI